MMFQKSLLASCLSCIALPALRLSAAVKLWVSRPSDGHPKMWVNWSLVSRLPKPALDQTRTGRTPQASCGTRYDGSWINTDKVPKRGPVESQRITVPSSYHRLLLKTPGY